MQPELLLFQFFQGPLCKKQVLHQQVAFGQTMPLFRTIDLKRSEYLYHLVREV